MHDQQAYFKFVVPESEAPNQNYLIYDLSIAGDEFSDPDIMISSVLFWLFNMNRENRIQLWQIASGNAQAMAKIFV